MLNNTIICDFHFNCQCKAPLTELTSNKNNKLKYLTKIHLNQHKSFAINVKPQFTGNQITSHTAVSLDQLHNNTNSRFCSECNINR